jgi:hypothetical protein
MNEPTNLDELADSLSLRIQELRGQGLLTETEPLLNLDYTSQAAQAPFLFDMARAMVHRNHCAAIPDSSKSTLYAVWELSAGDRQMACPVCRPHLAAPPPAETEQISNLLLGIVSFLDQFASVLRERGKEYRQSDKGNALVTQLEKLFADFARTDGYLQNVAHAFNLPGEPLSNPSEILSQKQKPRSNRQVPTANAHRTPKYRE